MKKIIQEFTAEELKAYSEATSHDCSKISSTKKYNWSNAIGLVLFVAILILLYLTDENKTEFFRYNGFWICFCFFTIVIYDKNRRIFILYKIIQKLQKELLELKKENRK